MMNAPRLGCAGSRKMVGFCLQHPLSCVLTAAKRSLRLCPGAPSPVLQPGHAPHPQGPSTFPGTCGRLNGFPGAKLPCYYAFMGLFAC